MDDVRLVTALGERDARGVGAVYDRYADPLYAYCWMLLQDHDAAADAVHNAFLVAVERCDTLIEGSRLRPWLYALARAECRRRSRRDPARAPRARQRAGVAESEPWGTGAGPAGWSRPPAGGWNGSGPTSAPGQASSPRRPDDTIDLGADPHPRVLTRQAVDALGQRDREVLELWARHKLDEDELALALGVSARRARVRLARARRRFDRALPAAVFAAPQNGSPACAALAELLADDEAASSTLTRRRLAAHLRTCVACASRRGSELSPVVLLRTLPTATAPASLRAGVLADARSPLLAPFRADLVEHDGPYRADGFPRGATRRRPALAPVTAVLLAFAVGAGVGVVMTRPGARSRPAAIPVHAPAPRPTPFGAASPAPAALAPSATPVASSPTPSLIRFGPAVASTPSASALTRPPAPGPQAATPLVVVTRVLAVPNVIDIGADATSATFVLQATGTPVSWHVSGASSPALSVAGVAGIASPGAPSSVTVMVRRDLPVGAGSITIAWTAAPSAIPSSGSLTVAVFWSASSPPATPEG